MAHILNVDCECLNGIVAHKGYIKCNFSAIVHNGDACCVFNVHQTNFVHICCRGREVEYNHAAISVVIGDRGIGIVLLDDEDIAHRLAVLTRLSWFTAFSFSRSGNMAFLIETAEVAIAALTFAVATI